MTTMFQRLIHASKPQRRNIHTSKLQRRSIHSSKTAFSQPSIPIAIGTTLKPLSQPSGLNLNLSPQKKTLHSQLLFLNSKPDSYRDSILISKFFILISKFRLLPSKFISLTSAFLILTALLVNNGWGQISQTYTFDSNNQGWGLSLVHNTNNTCVTGNYTLRQNYYSGRTSGTTSSPDLGTSNGGSVSVSYKYKIMDYGTPPSNAVSGDWGNLKWQWYDPTNNTWYDIANSTLNSSNDANNTSCNTINIPSFIYPSTTTPFIQIVVTRTSGDWFLWIDDITISQAAATPTTFYSKTNVANTDANTLSNWNSNIDGTSGSAPASFTTAGQTFIIQNGHQYQATGSWTGSSTSVIQVQSGGALNINAQTLSTWQRIDIAGTGVSSSGALLNSSTNAASLSIPVTLTAAATVISSGTGGLTLTGNITNGGYLLTVDGSNATAISTGVISGSGGLTKSGSGTLTLSGTNTYTGATTISAGTIRIGNASALGTTAAGTSITSGAVLDLNGINYSNAEALTVNGTGISSGGAIINSSATGATYAGLLTLGSASSIIGGTGTINISNAGTITGATFGLTLGGAQGGTLASILGTTTGTLTKQDAGTWTLSGANTYTGVTTINAGTLTLGVANALPISTPGTIQFAGGTPTFNVGAFNLGTSTSATAGALDFDVNTTINLASGATGAYTYYFAASGGQTWGATTTTINNWAGTSGTTAGTGTGARRIFIGSSKSLTQAQLDKITFTGYGAAMQLSTGEIVPVANYYSKSSGNLELTTSWGSKSDGSGTAPSNFAANGVSYTISNNSTPTIGASWTVSGSGSKVIVGDGTNACNFTVPGALTVTSPATDVSNNGTITRTTSGANSWGTLTFASGAKYVHNVSGGGTLPTATWNANSTLQIDQSVNDNEFTETFGNVEINGSSSFIMRTSGSAVTINGNLVFNSSGSVGVSSSANALTMSIGGSITHSGAGSLSYMANLGSDVIVNVTGNYIQSNGSAYLSNYYNDGSLNINGNFELTSGSFILNSDQGTSFARINNLNIGGNFNQSGGTLNLSQESSSFASSSVESYVYVAGNFSHTGGVITETAGQTAVVTDIILDGASGTQTLESIGQSGTMTFNVAGSNAQCVVAVSKTFVQSANTTFTIADGTSTPDLLINGTFTRTGTSLATTGTMSVASGGTYQHNCNGQALPSATWDAASTCNITGTSSTTPTNFGQTFGNLTVNCSGTATTDANSTVAGNLTVTGGTLTVGNNFTLGITGNSSITGTLTLGGNGAKTFTGNTTINPSGTLNVSGSGAYSLAGNFTNNGTFTPGSAILTLNGGGAQTLDGTSALSFSNVTINKSGGTLTAAKDMTITGTLTLTSGILDMNSKTLSMGTSSANGTITGGSASSYIVALDAATPSKLIHRVNSTSNSTYSFPIGTGSKYTPVTVVMKGGTLSNASIQVWTKNSKVTGMSDAMSCHLNRSWFVEPTGITSPTYDIQLGFASGDFTGDAGGDLNPVKLSSGVWYKPSGSLLQNGTTQGTTIATTYISPSTPTSSSGTVYWNGLTSFSEFGGGGGSAPLPVELVSFSGSCEDGSVHLSWQTASEFNSSHFDVEKSRDGENWQVIETIPAAGNSLQLLNYETFEQVSNALNYYRLNQVDIDGTNKRYDPIAVSCEASSNGIFITYPNPSNEGFNILINDKELEGEMNMNIYSATGSITLQKRIVVKEGINVFMMNEKLLPGVYFIEVKDEQNKTKVIKHLVN